MSTATTLYATGYCTVHDCHTRVNVLITRDGGLPVVDARGYSGVTASCELVCPDHFCPHCGDYHDTVDAYDRCRYEAPACDADCLIAALSPCT